MDLNTSKKWKIDWGPTLFLTLTPVAAIVTCTWYLQTQSFSWWALALCLVFYTLTAMSISGGYHRLFSHKAYDASWAVRLFYTLFGAAAFQNSILKWATDHRIHHRFVDSDRDPYSISKGFLYAHIGWMLLKEEPHPQHKAYQRDLVQDKMVVWQDKYYAIIAVAMGLVLPAILGKLIFNSFLGGLAFGGFLRLVAVHHGTFLINSLSHWWGRQTYTDKNSARDNLVAAFLTFGEGYHNFHHLFANDYRNGVRWYHWDPTKWMIKLKSYFGLVYNLKKTPEATILKAKLYMDERRLAAKTSMDHIENFRQKFEDLKQSLLESQQKALALKSHYQELKAQKTKAYKNHILQAKSEWKRAKKEWKEMSKQWKLLLSQSAQAYTYA